MGNSGTIITLNTTLFISIYFPVTKLYNTL